MIDCNDIAVVATELKDKFEKCRVLEAEDMKKLIELIEAVENCKLDFSALQTFDSDAAAASLDADTVYKTTTGELRIKL